LPTPRSTSKQVAEALQRLERCFPNAGTALHHETPFQLLIATILSAQCTDRRVNQVTPVLFQYAATPETLRAADLGHIETIIHSTGFYRAKAKNIVGCARGIVERFHGKVPDTIEELTLLPGVGRKTANVVLGVAFGQPAVVVDTHVRRVAQRLKWSRANDPDKIETDLCRLMPKSQWTAGSSRLLLHGRHTCTARAPHCVGCVLFDLCPVEEKKRAARLKRGEPKTPQPLDIVEGVIDSL